ncbi:MAG: T3SS effector HopA1 family protein [Pseudomonadota bacterium]
MERVMHDTLSRVFDDLTLVSRTAFRLADGPVIASDPSGDVAGLVPLLTNALYTAAYANEYGIAPDVPQFAPDHPLRLAHANQSRDIWDPGWQVAAVQPDGAISALKDGVEMVVPPGGFIGSQGPWTPTARGAMVTVFRPGGSHTVQAGFYYVYGEAPIHVWSDHALFRFYFNTTPQGAVALVAWVSQLLNAYSVPFRMKALTDPTHYTRADSAVLYVSRRFNGIVSRLLLAGKPEDAVLKPRVPLFTYPLAEGVGVADDPGNAESFGMQRCRLVAEAVLGLSATGQADTAARLQAVEDRFVQAGLNPDAPWRGTGRSDMFDDLRAGEAA